MSRFIRILTISSVMLNLVLIGIIIGGAGHYAFMPPPPPGPPHGMAESLPQEKRQLFEEAMEKLQPEKDKIRAEMRAAKEESLRLLKAESFDREAYLANARKIQLLRTRMGEQMAQVIADLAEKLEPKDRESLSGMFRKPPPPGFPPPDGAMPPPPPPE